jgi:hypothetical protein
LDVAESAATCWTWRGHDLDVACLRHTVSKPTALRHYVCTSVGKMTWTWLSLRHNTLHYVLSTVRITPLLVQSLLTRAPRPAACIRSCAAARQTSQVGLKLVHRTHQAPLACWYIVRIKQLVHRMLRSHAGTSYAQAQQAHNTYIRAASNITMLHILPTNSHYSTGCFRCGPMPEPWASLPPPSRQRQPVLRQRHASCRPGPEPRRSS